MTERCARCNKVVRAWHRRKYITVYPIARRDLKMDYKLRPVHYPDCEEPEEAKSNKELVVK